MRDFTGDESPADVVRLSIEDFSKSSVARELGHDLKIYYQGSTPFLMYRARIKNDFGEFVCHYRLDKMLLKVLPECEKIYEEADKYKLLEDDGDAKRRQKVVNILARYAMKAMLSHLLLNQAAMFEENFSDTSLLTAGVFLGALGQEFQAADADKAVKAVKGGVRKMLNSRLDHSVKKKREFLVRFLNKPPMLFIPEGVGRPKGSTKPKDVKAQEAAEYEKKVEAAIRKLISPKGKMPTKKAVAKELGIGGLSAGGTDSTLTNFGRKLKSLKIDYDAIVERVKVDK